MIAVAYFSHIASAPLQGGSLDPTKIKVKVSGLDLTVQGKQTIGSSPQGGMGLFVPELTHIVEAGGRFTFRIPRGAMAKSGCQTITVYGTGTPLVLDGESRIWAEDGFWKNSTIRMTFSITTVVLQGGATLLNETSYSESWKKTAGKKYLEFHPFMIPATKKFQMDKDQELILIRTVKWRVKGEGKTRIHFGHPDVTKYHVSATCYPPSQLLRV